MKSWAAQDNARVQLGQKPIILVLVTVAVLTDLLSTNTMLTFINITRESIPSSAEESNTHIECGFIIYDGELHNVGIHWLLSGRGEDKKENCFMFRLQEAKNPYPYLPKFATWEESLSCSTKQNTHKATAVTAHTKAATPGTASPYWLSQAASWFYWGSLCSIARSSVSLESRAAVLQDCYLWHTHCYAAGTSSEAGTEPQHSAIFLLQHSAKIA